MDAKQYFLMPFKKAFDFKSKTNRKDFWLGIVFLAIAVFLPAFPLVQLQFLVNETFKIVLGGVYGIYMLYGLTALYALAARRLNDRGNKPRILWAIPITNILPIIAINYFENLFYLLFLIKIYTGFHFLYLFCTNKKVTIVKRTK